MILARKPFVASTSISLFATDLRPLTGSVYATTMLCEPSTVKAGWIVQPVRPSKSSEPVPEVEAHVNALQTGTLANWSNSALRVTSNPSGKCSPSAGGSLIAMSGAVLPTVTVIVWLTTTPSEPTALAVRWRVPGVLNMTFPNAPEPEMVSIPSTSDDQFTGSRPAS